MNKCNNCGRSWHVYKQCRSPITSNGIININEEKKYLMICRKKSLGYVDFLRGKYSFSSTAHLVNLIEEMTIQEKRDLLTKTFSELWQDLWGVKPDGGSDAVLANEKFSSIVQGCVIEGKRVTLAELIQSIPTNWTEPEWGFPKGRRNNYETDSMCALREYEEETGYDRADLNIIRNIMPYEEIFIGSNYKSYKHKYFIARSKGSQPKKRFQDSEVSNLQWFTYEEVLEKIRPYNVERKQIVSLVHSMLDEYVTLN
jgi:8-oxo-dGTP pyrophosphatase MutT (NUDIX family)